MAEPPPEHTACLSNVFGLPGFRGAQYSACKATLDGRDSLCVLPTGAGKSLTFQFPPHTRDNAFTVVIGPIIALMKDQVCKCQELGIEAVSYHSDVQEPQKASLIRDLACDDPGFKLLYTTPESLRQPRLRDALKEALSLGTLMAFAIDEAHCVSEWGHDFRPAYLELCTLKQEFPSVPVAALTASCTEAVQESIIRVLQLHNPVVIRTSLNRHNIEYVVKHKELLGNGSEEDALEDLAHFITSRPNQCGIIYARLRSTCDWLAKELQNLDLDVSVYHAGKDARQRQKVQSEWSEGFTEIVVATIAFGMGIDRPDVRWVVHWNPPSSMEGFYQESGRAGRDGQPSVSVLYTSKADMQNAKRMERGFREGSVEAMADLVLTPCCRRQRVMSFFGEKRQACGQVPGEARCDVCSNSSRVKSELQALAGLDQQGSVASNVRARMQVRSKAGTQGTQPHGLPAQQQAPQASQASRNPGWAVALATLRKSGESVTKVGQPGQEQHGDAGRHGLALLPGQQGSKQAQQHHRYHHQHNQDDQPHQQQSQHHNHHDLQQLYHQQQQLFHSHSHHLQHHHNNNQLHQGHVPQTRHLQGQAQRHPGVSPAPSLHAHPPSQPMLLHHHLRGMPQQQPRNQLMRMQAPQHHQQQHPQTYSPDIHGSAQEFNRAVGWSRVLQQPHVNHQTCNLQITQAQQQPHMSHLAYSLQTTQVQQPRMSHQAFNLQTTGAQQQPHVGHLAHSSQGTQAQQQAHVSHLAHSSQGTQAQQQPHVSHQSLSPAPPLPPPVVPELKRRSLAVLAKPFVPPTKAPRPTTTGIQPGTFPQNKGAPSNSTASDVAASDVQGEGVRRQGGGSLLGSRDTSQIGDRVQGGSDEGQCARGSGVHAMGGEEGEGSRRAPGMVHDPAAIPSYPYQQQQAPGLPPPGQPILGRRRLVVSKGRPQQQQQQQQQQQGEQEQQQQPQPLQQQPQPLQQQPQQPQPLELEANQEGCVLGAAGPLQAHTAMLALPAGRGPMLPAKRGLSSSSLLGNAGAKSRSLWNRPGKQGKGSGGKENAGPVTAMEEKVYLV